MQLETILLTKEGGIAKLTLNRPEKRNAISQQMTEELRAAIDEVGADDNVRVLVLAANGPVFCAGVLKMHYKSEQEREGLYKRKPLGYGRCCREATPIHDREV